VRPLVPVKASDGESAKLICTVSGKPIPTISWFQGQRELQPSRDFQPTYDSTTGIATLFIAEVFPDDEGVYRCKATNKHGVAECEANLIVGTDPSSSDCMASRINLCFVQQVTLLLLVNTS
jgi:titin